MHLKSKFELHFPRPAVLPVIHMESQEQAKTNVQRAIDAGADGVFLINHESSWQSLLTVYRAVRAQFPEVWIGLNFLDLPPRDALRVLPIDAQGLWSDNAGVAGALDTQPAIAYAHEFRTHQLAFRSDIVYFGGVAFKYQGPVANPAMAAATGARFMDVVTTSGERTGQEPSIEKIKAMKGAIKDNPHVVLGIASGINVDNIRAFSEYASAFLVASSISDDFYTLNTDRIKALIAQLRP